MSEATRRLTEAEIEDCIDRASRKFSSRRRGPSGQQLTSYDDWMYWFAREVEDAVSVYAAVTAPGAPQQEASRANWNEERQTDQSVTPEFTAWLARPGQHCQGVGANEAWNAGVAWASRAAATAPAGGVKNLQAAVRKVLIHHNLLNGRPGDGVIEADLIAALTTAARAAEPAYHCIGFIEQYGRMIGDTQQGKQTIPVYVRAASPTPPMGTSKERSEK